MAGSFATREALLVCNEIQSNVYVFVDGERSTIAPGRLATLDGWRNRDLKIAWLNGNGEYFYMLAQTQVVAGRFTISQAVTPRGLRMPPKLVFDPHDDASGEAYTEEQYRQVGVALQDLRNGECGRKHCPCLQGLQTDPAGHLSFLVKQGAVTSEQLQAIIRDMF
ncbi:Hypothetical protein UVM_LOCUS390 [uncultured virus]|nr:Hypothetical protein UVM_LOCUS390 [uncultured virus]